MNDIASSSFRVAFPAAFDSSSPFDRYTDVPHLAMIVDFGRVADARPPLGPKPGASSC